MLAPRLESSAALLQNVSIYHPPGPHTVRVLRYREYNILRLARSISNHGWSSSHRGGPTGRHARRGVERAAEWPPTPVDYPISPTSCRGAIGQPRARVHQPTALWRGVLCYLSSSRTHSQTRPIHIAPSAGAMVVTGCSFAFAVSLAVSLALHGGGHMLSLGAAPGISLSCTSAWAVPAWTHTCTMHLVPTQ